jgi:hypothetical protein
MRLRSDAAERSIRGGATPQADVLAWHVDFIASVAVV